MKTKFLLALIFVPFVSFSQTSWSDGVGQLFQANCVQCHRQGGIAPFSLETYAQVLPWAGSIQSAIASGAMPPWTPDPNYKHFVSERVMSATDKTSILDWIANGAPEGDPALAPSIPVFPTTTQLGTPDLSVTIPTFTVPSNTDVYHNFELPSGLSQAMYINAIEVVPGNTSAVHHVLVFQDSTNNPINPTSMGGTGSNASKLIFGYTPGALPYYTPLGTGFRLPANTRIIVQVHYAPGTLGQSDATTVNFKLTSSPQREITVNPILNHANMTNGPLVIPANQEVTFNQQYDVLGNWTLLYTFPHMHLIGRSIKSWANLPVTNDTLRFIDIPEWEFHWQNNFVFPNPVIMPSGSTMRSEAEYDNTVNNPENPSNPPQTVAAGEGTYDEMMYVFFAYLPYQAGDEYMIVDSRITPQGATTFCNGQTVLLKTIEGLGYTYQWQLNGSPIPGETASSYLATAAGDYTVEISIGPNSTVSDPVTVVVNTAPTASVSIPGVTHIPLGGTIQLDANAGAFSYQWYLDGAPIFGATNATCDATQNGDYFVTVYDGCFAKSNTVSLTAEASLFEWSVASVTLAPNPSSDFVTVSCATVPGMKNVRIHNASGQEFYSGQFESESTQLNVAHLATGLYFIQVKLAETDQPIVLKFVKE